MRLYQVRESYPLYFVIKKYPILLFCNEREL